MDDLRDRAPEIVAALWSEAERHPDVWLYRDAADLIEQLTAEPPNDPLTLEELRGMDGEPVWNDTVKHRSLVDAENERTVGKDGIWRPLDDRYYRRKPDGGGDHA